MRRPSCMSLALALSLAGLLLVSACTQNKSPPTPNAEFAGTPTDPAYPNLTVEFTDLSTGEIAEWRWDFNGDGIVDSTYQQKTDPSWRYPSVNRSYTVTLTVAGPQGEDTETKASYIRVAGCPG